MNNSFIAVTLPALMLLALLQTGCSPAHYRRQADREVSDIITAKSREVPGAQEEFSIEPAEVDLLAGLPTAPPEIRLEDETGNAQQPLLLDLENALHIAATGSREYQSRKEAVFLRALALTGERNRFQPRFFWNIRGESTYDSNDKWSAGAQSRPGAEWLLSTGARLSAGLSTTATRFLSGDPRSVAGSVFDLTLTQPLLRDGRIAAIEPLTQAERDMIYELREFVRFQRRFTVGVLADYYRVLEQRQRVKNQQVNYDNIVRIRRRAEALGEAGRVPELQIDRARQDELSASDSLDAALQTYYRALDNFKITLGLKPETSLLLDPAELDRLFELEMAPPPPSRRESIEIALNNRLDLATKKQEVEDARRRVLVAENALNPGLDLVLGSTARTDTNRPVDFAGGTRSSFARLDAELPLERTDERNTYRRRLIEYDRAERDVQAGRDAVVLEVTNRWRDFDRAVSSYEIQRRSVELAEERVESTEMLLDAGRAIMRDVLDAHEDLLRAQDRLAGTLVDFRVAALELERDMDILVIGEEGQLKEGEGYYEHTDADR